MKKVITLIIFIFSVSLYANIDERLSDVYFANGIDTSEEQANDAKNALDKQTKKSNPEAYKSIANWKVSYNKTKGFQQDIYESSVQKIFTKLDESHSLSQYSGALVWIVDTVFELPGVKSLVKGAIYYAGKKIVKEELKDLLLDEAKRTFAKKGLKLTKEEIAFLSDVLFDELLDNLLSGTLEETRDDINTDVETQALAYAESIKQGHGVIIVAHSQGNFFTNFVVEEKMVDWTKQYFNVIGVATPTSSIANGGPHLTFNNDVIQVVPEHLASNIPNPKHYYIENAIGEKIETFVSIEAHSFLSSYMATDVTRDAILGFIDGSVTVHKTAPSQWEKSATTGCGCDQRIEVAHKFDAELNKQMKGLSVIAFDETNKLYPTGSDYVKAAAEGDSLVKYDSGDICIDLLDANETKIDDFKGRTPVVTSAQGDIEVTLSWDNGADYDLELDMPGSVHDVESCSMEHAYVKSEFSIYPGRYPVNVTKASTGSVSGVYYVSIATPGESKVLKVDANTTGHIADIIVKYVDNKPVLEVSTPSGTVVVFENSGTGGGSYSGGSSSNTSVGGHSYIPDVNSSECTPAKSCGCMPCEYWVVPYLGQALTGPLSGADIALYRLDGFRTNSAMYSGKTSTGNTLYTAGLLNIPEETIAGLDDNALYIITVSGGMDIDADDDMEVDDIPTQNLGTLHAILRGSELKAVKPKVNILTEVAYQIVKDDIANAGKTDAEIIATLDDVALRLLRMKIYSQSKGDLSHIDLLEWLPTLEKSLLYASYQSQVVPIVKKLLLDNDIYEYAYNLVYFPDGILPVLQSEVFYIQEDASINTIIGTVPVRHEGNSSIESMQLYGAYADTFTIDVNGVIRLQQPLDFESVQQYYLEVTATNNAGESKETAIYIAVQDVKDAPLFTGYTAGTVYSSSEAGTYVGKLEIDEGISPITSIRLTGEDSNYFQISMDGNISVNQTLKNYFLTKKYIFQAIATNDSGDSRPATITVNISDGGEIPILKSLDINVIENSPEGTIIAQAEFVRQGKSEVDAYYLKESSGEDSNLFNITAQGEIVVAPGAIIDFEKTTSYVRWLSVHNSFGNSPTVKVTIHVIDLLVEPPVTNPTGLNILENSESGTHVGQLQFNKGGVQDVSIELSGPGSENFTVDNDDGLVMVAPSANLDFERVAYYDLDYKVTNTAGSSSNKLYISVNDVPDVAAILHNGTFTQYYHEFIVGNAVGNVLSKIGDSPIKTITLSPDSPFGASSNGNVYLQGALNTEMTNFVLTAIAEDSYGKSNASTIEINVLAQPHLAATALSIGENAPGGTFVGKIKVISEGPVSIDSFTLSDTTDFVVDGNGTVRVAVGADLNFEKQQKYHLLAHAYNAFGQSNIVTLDIALNNIPETAPVLRNVSTFYYTGQPSNISLGNIIVSHGDTPINVLTLLPASPFTVEFDGSIRLSEELPVSSPSEFNLTAEAGNAFGKSNQANVDILVCTQASECMEYVRQLYMELQQASLGPIAGASFLLQELDTGSNSVIFESVTSTSELLVDNGIIVFPQTLQESVAPNDLFILSVNGGNDMDADDDFEFDETPQQNLGTIRAILSGAHVQGESFKVNVLTEIAYQALHRRFDENTTNQSVSAMLNEVSKRLIKNDLNKDGVITYKDTTSWLPGFDKEKLQFDYDAKIEPIVQKIYNNEDIYLDVYKLLYADKIDSLEFDNNATGNSIRVDLNSYADLSQLRKEDFVLKDSSGNSVDFTFGIVDDKVVIDPLNDFVEGQSYTLSFNLEIYDDQNNVYIDSQSHEFIVPDMTPPVIPESTIHINENYGGELPFSATDPSTPIMYTLIEGADKDKFEVKNSGSSLYFKEAPNYERPSDSNGDNIYELDISVADSFANTTTQSIRIIIDDLKEAPLLADTYMTVNENMPIGTYVGSVTVLNEGDGNITSFSTYSDTFRIDATGKIYTKEVLDYERTNEYNLSVRATNSVNAYAASKMSNIKVSDIEEPIPHVHNFTGSMDDHAPEGKVVGQLYVYPGLDEEVTIRLLGEGADDFDVNSTGHVTVSATADLDHTVQKQYDLKVIASNSYGDSEEANVTIYTNIWTKQANDLGSSIFVDTQDNIYTAIEIGGGVSVNKFNAQGVKLWKQEYLGHERVTIQSIVVDDNGTVYLACKQGTKPYTGAPYNKTYYRTSALVLVLSSSGELWNKSVDTGSAYYDEFTKITLDIDGNLILAGKTNGTLTGEINHGGSDPFLIKLSNQGETIWIQQYGSSGYDFASDVEFNSKNELYFLAENPTWKLMRIDQSDGHILWSKQLDPLYEGSWMYCYDFLFDNADNAYILAAQDKYWEVDGSDYYDGEVLVTKLDNDGSIIWRKTYGSERYEEPAAMAISSNNELSFVGRTDGSTYSNVSKTPYLWKWEEADFFLISTDTNGNIIETKQFGSIGWDFVKAMAIDTNNNIYMTGFVDGSLDGNVYKVESNYNTGFLMKVP